MFCMCIAIAKKENMDLEQMVVTTTFLHIELKVALKSNLLDSLNYVRQRGFDNERIPYMN